MNKKKRKIISASLLLVMSASIVTTVYAGTSETNADSLPRKSQWTSSLLTEDPIIQVPPNPAQPVSAERASSNSSEDVEQYSTDRIIVKYKDNNLSKSVSTNAKITNVKQLASIGADVLTVAEGTDTNSLIEQLKKDPNVLYAEPDHKFFLTSNPALSTSEAGTGSTDTTSTASTAPAVTSDISNTSSSAVSALPTDEQFPEQWALHNTGQRMSDFILDPPGTPGIDLGALDAWKITKGKADVVVAIIGTGLDPTIKELQDQLWTDPEHSDVHGWNFVQNNNHLYDPKDGYLDDGGTAMAGLIAAAENGYGIVGIAPEVKIMPLKVVAHGEDTTLETMLSAIEYAKDHGAQIVVTALGTRIYNKTLQDVIESSGMLFVTAAGDQWTNTDNRPVYPGAYGSDNIINVTAIDNHGWQYFNYGQKTVDVAAPGVAVMVPLPEHNYGYAAQIEDGFKAIYTGFRFDDLDFWFHHGENPEPDIPGGGWFKHGASNDTQALSNGEGQDGQDAFNKAMDYLTDSAEPADTNVLIITSHADDEQPNSDPGDGGIIFRDNESDTFPYKNFLINGGYTSYEHQYVEGDADGPSLDELKQYDAVIWYGNNVRADRYLSDKAVTTLTAYLEDGGHLLLSGDSLFKQIETSSFVKDTLHLQLMGRELPAEAEADEADTLHGTDNTIYDSQTYRLPNGTVAGMFQYFWSNDSTAKVNLSVIAKQFIKAEATEYSAAYTAGVAALVLSNRPEMDAASLKQRLVDSGRAFSSLTGITKSGKMINAYRALSDYDIPGVSFQGPAISNSLDAASRKNDVYSIQLYAGETLDLSLSGGRGTDFDLYLYDSSATTIKNIKGLVAYSENKQTSKETITYTATKTGTYYINVFAYAGAGAYTLTARYGNEAGIYEDDNDKVLFNDIWLPLADPSYSGGGLKQTNSYGSVELSFFGNSIEWLGLKNNQQGIADVYIDGVKVASPSLYSESPLAKQTIFSQYVEYGHHLLTIKWTGKKDPASKTGGTAINVDAFAVKHIIEENDTAVVLKGVWATSLNSKHSGNTAKYTDKTSSSAKITFEGSEVTLFAYTNQTKGKANIFIDGKLVTPAPIDLYSQTYQYQVPVFKSAALSKGTHTLSIVSSGQKNANASGYGISFDKLVVTN